MQFQSESQKFTIELNGREYRMMRHRSHYNKWRWEWTVHGGTVMHSRYCDPEGRTYKQAVAAAERWLSGNPDFSPTSTTEKSNG